MVRFPFRTRRIGEHLGLSSRGVRIRSTDLSQPTDLFGAAKFTGQSGNYVMEHF